MRLQIVMQTLGFRIEDSMLSLQNIHKEYDEKTVLDGINLSVNAGEVVALIGENGAGKTTLLKLLLAEVAPDSGTINLHHEIVGYVPQEPAATADSIMSYFDTNKRWRVEYALEKTGLAELPDSTAINDLSGGQKTRLALAKVLAADLEPTVLLFDEPTNNLDSDGLRWLENFIRSFRGGVILVSHDRMFINKVATKVAELHHGHLKQYGGNYDFYKEQKAVERDVEIAKYEQFTHEKKRLTRLRAQQAGQMQRASSEKFDKVKHETKMGFNSSKNLTQKSLGQKLKALDSRIEQLDEVRRPEPTKHYKVALDGKTTQNKLILRLKDICKVFSKQIFTDVTLEVRGKTRIRIMGANGSGKTTLLKIAAGLLEPDSGTVDRGMNVKIGYFSQDVDGLDYSQSGLVNLQSTGADSTTLYREARSLGLTEHDLAKKPAVLSRGQQAKLGFAKLLLGANHLLVLDEPTNHLDMQTREAIETALRNYEGALLIASHDTYFLRQIDIHEAIDLDMTTR